MDKVTYFEIPFDEKERAQSFYSKIFGWEITDAPGDFPYWFLTTTPSDENMVPKEKNAINGGMFQREDKGATKPVIVIGVEDAEKRCKQIEAEGGTIVMPPKRIDKMGIYALFKDTENNVIGLWQCFPR